MGWLVAAACMFALVILVQKALDEETKRNFKFLGKVVGAVLILVMLLALVNFIH
jgi:hypothetical protein